MLLFALLCGAIRCGATTVVVLRTGHDMVIGADAVSGPGSSGSHAPANRSLVVVDGRIVCAGAVQANIMNDSSYSFSAILADAKAAASPGIPVSMFVQLLEGRLATKYKDAGGLLKAGKLRPEDLPPPSTILLKYYVAGFEANVPFVYTIEYDVDWDNARVTGPIVTPQPPRRNLSVTWTGGAERGIVELRKPNPSASQSTQKTAALIAGKFAAEMPEENAALQEDRDLAAPKLLRLACGLLDLEVSRNPKNAAYPLTVISVPMSGMPKTVTYQQKCG